MSFFLFFFLSQHPSSCSRIRERSLIGVVGELLSLFEESPGCESSFFLRFLVIIKTSPTTSTTASSSLSFTAAPAAISTSSDNLKRKLDSDGAADGPPAKKPEPASADDDALEEALTCGICQDVLYKCVALIPCLHTFCCACVTDWIDRKTDCPECRKVISGVNKPHQIQNMVDAYLAKHPDKKRTAAEVAELDPRSDIGKLAVCFLSFSISFFLPGLFGGFMFLPFIIRKRSRTMVAMLTTAITTTTTRVRVMIQTITYLGLSFFHHRMHQLNLH